MHIKAKANKIRENKALIINNDSVVVNTDLKKYLEDLDSKVEPFDEIVVAEKIKEILTKEGKTVTNKLDQAEYATFYFWPNDSDNAVEQKKYYFPMMSGTTKDGQTVEFPDSRFIDLEVLEYWTRKANKSKHPLLACRYADLVVDFGQRTNNGKFDYLMSQKVIDMTIRICSQSLEDGLGCKQKLKRALFLAKLINDSARQSLVQRTIIDTESKFAEDDKPGLWGYGFAWLILDQSQEKLLTDQQKKFLINNLEQRLSRLMSGANPNSWNVEYAVLLLSKHYAQINDVNRLEIVLKHLESAFRKNTYANSDGLLVVNYLERLSEIYRVHTKYPFAQKAIQRIKKEMSNLSKHTKLDLKKISIDLNIKKEEIDAILNSIYGEKREKKFNEVIKHMVITFVPRKDKVEKELKDYSAKYVYLSLGNHSILSDDGFSSAKYGSIQEDFPRHLLNHFSQNLHFQSAFLRLTFNELTKLMKPEDVYKVLSDSPVFRNEDKNYLLKVLDHYWGGDYLSASCLMIPLIEDAVRNIFRLNNLSFIKENDDGGYDVESLNRLLESGVIKQIYGSLGEHIEFYFRVLLTERIGWNLRNNFAHGINKNSFMRVDVADRLLHVLFCLSLVRKKNDKK